jgi:hypothetical protein
MIKSLLLAVVCGYTNPPGLQPNVPAVQVHFDLLKELGMAGLQGAEAAAANEAAGRPLWQLAPEHVAADDLCSKLAAEPAATSEALNAFVDPTATWHLETAAATAAASQAYREAFWAHIPVPPVVTVAAPQHPQLTDAFAMEPVPMPQPRPTTVDPRSGNQGRTFGLPGSDAAYRRYQ